MRGRWGRKPPISLLLRRQTLPVILRLPVVFLTQPTNKYFFPCYPGGFGGDVSHLDVPVFSQQLQASLSRSPLSASFSHVRSSLSPGGSQVGFLVFLIQLYMLCIFTVAHTLKLNPTETTWLALRAGPCQNGPPRKQLNVFVYLLGTLSRPPL